MKWRNRTFQTDDDAGQQSYGITGGQPLQSNNGHLRPNPHVLYGQNDIDTMPVTFNRIGTRWGDEQLINAGAPGWVISPLRLSSIYQKAGYLNVIQPMVPGQSRLSGGPLPGGYVPHGNSPSQWQKAAAQTAGSQPATPGGPGQMWSPNGFIYGGNAGA